MPPPIFTKMPPTRKIRRNLSQKKVGLTPMGLRKFESVKFWYKLSLIFWFFRWKKCSWGFEFLNLFFYQNAPPNWGWGGWGLGVRKEWKPLSRREIRILAQLGLGVAPRFLQKVRAFAEILTNKLGLFSAAKRRRPRAVTREVSRRRRAARPEPLSGGEKP